MPEAKLYPADKREVAIALMRGSAIMNRLFSDGELLLVVAYLNGYRGKDDPPCLLNLEPVPRPGWVEEWFPEFADYVEDAVLSVAIVPPDAGRDDLLLAGLLGEIAPIIFFSPRDRAALSPYEGGFDVFLSDSERRAELRNEYSAWASPRADGL